MDPAAMHTGKPMSFQSLGALAGNFNKEDILIRKGNAKD